MEIHSAVNEDWKMLVSFFPKKWKELAASSGALKGLRQDKSEENYLRVLLMHVGCGFSLRETVLRAQQAGIANLSDVALLKRLRKSKEWLYQLCCELFFERGISGVSKGKYELRLIDATVVKEPGKTGSQWRVHYSFRWPKLECDYFKITPTAGDQTGESIKHHPIQVNDHIVVDRGYCHASDIHFVSSKKAFVSVRLNPQGIRLEANPGERFPLLLKLKTIREAGQIGEWDVQIPMAGTRPLPVRLCVVRKSHVAAVEAEKKLRRYSSKHGTELQPETLIYAKYVMVITTFPKAKFSGSEILDVYRFRWQIELVFKRLKQIAQFGHLPKYDDDSAKAWLYGKLFVALLTEKLIGHADALSPWGYALEVIPETQSLA